MKMTRENYKKKVEAQLGRWTDRLDKLQAAEKAGAVKQKKAFLADLEELKKFQEAGKKLLASLEASAAASWDEAKDELTDKWNHVSGGFDAVWARFR